MIKKTFQKERFKISKISKKKTTKLKIISSPKNYPNENSIHWSL